MTVQFGAWREGWKTRSEDVAVDLRRILKSYDEDYSSPWDVVEAVRALAQELEEESGECS